MDSEITYDFDAVLKALSLIDIRNSLILDIGSGNGKRAATLRSLGAKVIGIDVSITSLKKANEKGIEVIYSDARHLPILNESFKLITCLHVIEHLPDGAILLKEILRILTPGGCLILVTPNKIRLSSFLSLVSKMFFRRVKYPMNPDHMFEYTENNLKQIFDSNEFSEYRLIPLFFGLNTKVFGRRIAIGYEQPPKKLSKFCNQWLVIGKKR